MDGRIHPWYLPRSFKVTMSLTIIIDRDMMPPFAIPASARKMYSIVALTDKLTARSLSESRTNADMKIFFLPNRSLSLP